jgi:nucleoside-diphosphate-sugar epimerase
MMGRLVLVTGTGGAVGRRVVECLHRAGYSVRALDCVPLTPESWLGHVDPVVGDITDIAVVSEAVREVDAVVHLAALLHQPRGSRTPPEAYQAVNVGGTRNLLTAASHAGVRRFVLFSTIAVYGSTEGLVLDEWSPLKPDSPYASTKASAEELVLRQDSTGANPEGVVLRLAAVYGSRVKANYLRLVQELSRGTFIPIGAGTNRRTLIYDRDVDEVVRAVCAALGRRPPRMRLPSGAIRTCVTAAEVVLRLAGQKTPTVTRDLLDKYLEDVAVDGSRITRELGFCAKYDLWSGWKETIDEMRASGRL